MKWWEPPDEPVRYSWCDCCDNWEPCPDSCGFGWCRDIGEFTEPDGTEECSGFTGERPDEIYDSIPDAMRWGWE